jgi:hypothetical protein
MGLSANTFTPGQRLLLWAITLTGAILRIIYTYDRPFTGDEIGTLIHIQKSYSYLLSHFETWLTMNYFLAAEKMMVSLSGGSHFSLLLLPMVAGIITIPLTSLLAARFTSAQSSLLASALVALNPFLIKYSGIIRAYSLLVCLSILTLILFFRWREKPTLRGGLLTAVSSLFLVVVHPNGIYVVAYILLIVLADQVWKKDWRDTWLSVKTLAFPMLVAGSLILLAYWRILPEMLLSGEKWHDTPPTGISYLPVVFSDFFAGGLYGLPSLLLLIAGVGLSYVSNRKLLLLLPFLVLPVVLISLQGLSHFPSAYSRFLIFTVPVLLIFLAEGIWQTTRKIHPPVKTIFPVVVTLVLVLSWLPGTIEVFSEKRLYPWDEAALLIQENHTNDIILCNDNMVCLHLFPYLPESEYKKMTFENFLEKDTLLTSGRIYYVSSDCAINTSFRSYLFGRIQVAEYTVNEHFLKTLRDDLITSVGSEEADPHLTHYYKHIYFLNRKLGEEEGNNFYHDLWLRSSKLTNREKQMPPQMGRKTIPDDPPDTLHGREAQ